MSRKISNPKSVEAPPSNSVEVLKGFGNFILRHLGFGDRVYVEATAVSHLTPLGGFDKIDKQPLPNGRYTHAGAEHVGKSFEELQGRIVRGETKFSSSFRDKLSATKYISLTIDANKEKIFEFLNTPDRERITLRCRFSESVGYGVVAKNIGEQVESRFVIVVLSKNINNLERPYEIVTAFPDVTFKTGNRFIPWTPKDERSSFELNTDNVSKKDNSLETRLGLQNSFTPLPEWKCSSSLASFAETKETFYSHVQIPGGIILQPGDSCGFQIQKVVVSVEEPGVIFVNGLRFESGLSYEEINCLLDISASSKGTSATSLHNVEGTNSSNIIGGTLRLADEQLGNLVWRDPKKESLDFRELESLSDGQLAARAEKTLSGMGGVVSLEFLPPKFKLCNGLLLCEDTPYKVHFVPFQGNSGSPRFCADEQKIKEFYPEELKAAEQLSKSPASLRAQSNMFDKLQRYSAVLVLLNAARARSVVPVNEDTYHSIFNKRHTTIPAITSKPQVKAIHAIELDVIKTKLEHAGDTKDFIRQAAICYLYVASRNVTKLSDLGLLVASEMKKRIPNFEENPPQQISYLRLLACGLALGAIEDGSNNFQVNAHRLARTFQEQDIAEVINLFREMPLTSQEEISGSLASSGLTFCRIVDEMCRLGYARIIKEILLERISGYILWDPSQLSAISDGVKAAVCRCFYYLETDRDPQRGKAETPKSAIQRVLSLHVSASRQTHQFVGTTAIPTELLAEHRALSIAVSNEFQKLNIGPEALAMLTSFASQAMKVYRKLDWEVVSTSIKPEKYPAPALTSYSSGAERIAIETKILLGFQKISLRESSETLATYMQLIEGCLDSMRSKGTDTKNLLDTLVGISSHLFREKRLCLKNTDTLFDAVRTSTFDCDTICHLYYDILLKLGFSPMFVSSERHIHLAIGETHFEARGGVILSMQEAANQYGFMEEWSAKELAIREGVRAALELTYPGFWTHLRANLEMQNFMRDRDKMARNLVWQTGEENKYVELSAAQVMAIASTVRTILGLDPLDSQWLCYAAILTESLKNQKAFEVKELRKLRKELTRKALDALVKSSDPPEKLIRFLWRFRHDLKLTEDELSQLKSFPCNQTNLIDDIIKASTNSKRVYLPKASPQDFRELVISATSKTLPDQELNNAKVALAKLLSSQLPEASERDELSSLVRLNLTSYCDKTAGGSRVTDGRFIHGILAWTFPSDFKSRTRASLQLLCRHHRPDLALKWAKSIAQLQRANDNPYTIAAVKTLSAYGDIAEVHAFFDENPTTSGTPSPEPDPPRDSTHDYSKNMTTFALGGYQHAEASLSFVRQMGRLNVLDSATVQKLEQELEVGPMTATKAFRIASEIANGYAWLRAGLLATRNFDGLLNLEKLANPNRVDLFYIDAFKFREQGKFAEVLKLKDHLIEESKKDDNTLEVPVAVVLAEAFAFAGDNASANFYADIAQKGQGKGSAFWGEYSNELEISLLVAKNKLEEASELLAKAQKTNTYGYYLHSLKRFLLEGQYPELCVKQAA